jgi:hypothetical protein
MAKVTIRHSKQLSEHQIKQQLRKLREVDIEESLEECIQELQQFEKKFGMSSAEFYQKFCAGKMGDRADMIRWAGTFEDYMYLVQSYFRSQAKAR